jgi:hypothetical protein
VDSPRAKSLPKRPGRFGLSGLTGATTDGATSPPLRLAGRVSGPVDAVDQDRRDRGHRLDRAVGNEIRLTPSLEFYVSAHKPSGRSSVGPLASRVEWGAVEDEQAVGDLAVLDGDAFGTGSALDGHCFGVVHDYRLLVVTKGGNEL